MIYECCFVDNKKRKENTLNSKKKKKKMVSLKHAKRILLPISPFRIYMVHEIGNWFLYVFYVNIVHQF